MHEIPRSESPEPVFAPETVALPPERALDKKPYKQALAELAPIRKELQEVFDPLGQVAAARMSAEVAVNPDGVAERLMSRQTEPLPYLNNAMMLCLPPDLFGDLMPDSLPKPIYAEDPLELPDTSPVSQFAAEYIARREAEGRPVDESMAAPWDHYGAPQDYAERLNDFFDWNGTRIRQISSAEWTAYHAGYKSFVAKGAEAQYRELNGHRRRNGHSYEGITAAPYEGFIYSHVDTATENTIISELVMPVGEYGPKFAATLAKATAYMVEQIDAMDAAEIDAAVAPHRDAILEHTARGLNAKGDATAATRLVMQEGVISVAHTYSMLMAEHVPGYDDPVDLMDAITKAGLVERVTRLVPMGMVGPMALHGEHPVHPLSVGEAGGLELSEAYVAELKAAHVKHMNEVLKRLNPEPLPPGVTETGVPVHTELALTCPAAGKGGAVRRFGEVMAKIARVDAAQQIA